MANTDFNAEIEVTASLLEVINGCKSTKKKKKKKNRLINLPFAHLP